VAAALNARHVALWRPDRLEERLAAADEMIAVGRAAGERALELQARNWRVVDLFERFDIEEWRAEVRRHAALADELRLPAFQWYTPMWEAVDAVHCGRYEEGRRLSERARALGERAGDRNARLFADMLQFAEVLLREDWGAFNLELAEQKIATSPAAMSWRSALAQMYAATGDAEAARAHIAAVIADDFAGLPFDANWPSALAEIAEAIAMLGDARSAALVYERLLPYAERAITSGRAITSYGSTHRLLGALAAVMGRRDEAIARHRAGVRHNERAGYEPHAERGRRALAKLRA
jgi:hypothetical protein